MSAAATVLTVLATIATVAALSGLLLDRVTTPWRTTILLATFAPFLMALAPLAIVLAGFAQAWTLLVIAVVVAAGCAARQQRLHRAERAPATAPATGTATGTRVTVLQANLWLGRAAPGALARQVVLHNVDLLVVEELTTGLSSALQAALAEVAPHHVTARYAVDDGMIGIWSRYPLSHVCQLAGYRHAAVRADVTLPGGPRVRVVAVHLSTPWHWARQWWQPELRRLCADLDALGGDVPVLVAGDFNATTEHGQFRALLTGGYRDAAGQAGAGHPRTWPAQRGVIPIIAIDHVLTCDAVATSVDTVTVSGSDHRGLLVRTVLR